MSQKRRGYIILLCILMYHTTFSFQINGIEEFLSRDEKQNVEKIFSGFDSRCQHIKETDYPTIFIPGILGYDWKKDRIYIM